MSDWQPIETALIAYAVMVVVSGALFAYGQFARTGRVSVVIIPGAILWPVSWYLVYRVATAKPKTGNRL